MSTQEPLYHHGNLRQALLDSSLAILRSEGIEALSLRRLAEHAGVSRGAPYHHFRDKQALLAAIGELGFAELNKLLQTLVEDEQQPLRERLHQAVLGYLEFATQQPELYALMFGRTLWQSSNDEGTAEFQRYAKDCFRQYVHLFEQLDSGLGLPSLTHLRKAQLLWATLHGLAKLSSDGIFVKPEDLADIALQALPPLSTTSSHPAEIREMIR